MGWRVRGLGVAAICVLGVAVVPTVGALIDFEGLPYTLIDTTAGSSGNIAPAPGSALADQFRPQGVLFGKTGVSAGVGVIRTVDPSAVAPSSGLASVAGLDAGGLIPGGNGVCFGDIYMKFVLPGTDTEGYTDHVAFTIGDGGYDVDSFEIRLYGTSNNLLGSLNMAGASRFPVSIDVAGVHRIEVDFLNNGYGYSLDDLAFDIPTPEPATLSLLALGSLLIPRRRRV